jgi:hypothetical protein
VARLGPKAAIPAAFFAGNGFTSATRTDDELSLVYPEGQSLTVDQCEGGWIGFRVLGMLDFALVGILARLSAALAEAGISLYALSTYDTDYLFVKADQEEAARKALGRIATVL